MNPMRAIVELFSRHRNAANLLFFSMIMFGFFGLSGLNTQFFPTTEIKIVNINVPWPGATAQDVDKNIVATIQPEVRFIDGVKEFKSTSRTGFAAITVEFYPEAEIQKAVGDVEAAVNAITTLPKDAEKPIISQTTFFEPVVSVLLSGPFEERALRAYAKQLRDGLLSAGVDKVVMDGFRDEEIWVEAQAAQLRRYNMTAQDIADKLAGSSLDVPGGILRGEVERQVRAVGLAQTAGDVSEISLRSSADGRQIKVGDVARVYETFDANAAEGWRGDNRAIRLTMQRTKNGDALDMTDAVRAYIAETLPSLPPTLKVEMFDVNADKIRQRINVLLVNGLGGMFLVLCILFLFLNGRIAFWVAAGIPASLMATFGVMLYLGMTINMLSLFALIMTIGIIVDDAIVVGEHSATLTEQGADAQTAAEGGALRMMLPITAAALTTLAAFIPMLLITGVTGQFVRAIPLVLFSVLVASLIECFFVLPGHLSHALKKPRKPRRGIRKAFLDRFEHFRANRFKRFVTSVYDNRYTTAAVGMAILIICMGLLAGGRVPFRFFPSPEGEVVNAYVFFQPGTKRAETHEGTKLIEKALYDAEAKLLEQAGPEADEKLISIMFTQIGRTGASTGEERAFITAELTASEARTIRTKDIVKQWEALVPDIAGLRYVFIREQRGGPPGRDIDIRLQNADPEILKKAALEVRQKLEEYAGISRARDDLFYNKQELLLEVNRRGEALGFTNAMVGNLTRANLEGAIAKRFARGDEEVTLRVLQPRDGTSPKQLADIELPVPGSLTATGGPRYVPLTAIVDIIEKPGFSSVRRTDGQVAVSVIADYDDDAGDPNDVLQDMAATTLPQVAAKYNIGFSFGGRNQEQTETLGGLRIGAMVGLSLIYIVLAFVFASYSRPIIIMSVIPFGLIGMVTGHYVQGFDLTFLSLVGLLGLSGILVNNSIILISRIDERQNDGEGLREAVINGICDRLRAVTLTSMTTVLGLAPLLFETSVQAQFLLPMVITIAWGLGFASLIVLFLVPSVLGIQEDIRKLVGRLRGAPQEPLSYQPSATPEAGRE
ncbi:efflux RND transporter permease subunit [Alphaproteobacteria bacterium]|nr:efflux RND transporter permease subunit [Alphaproteobacteria bacterium]MDA8725485.1 efflux RND transporter permease subunit [Alphaproteobacteria bacterium]